MMARKAKSEVEALRAKSQCVETPRFTKEEELALYEVMMAGRRAREQLILSVKDYAEALTRSLQPTHMIPSLETEELTAEAMLATIEIIDKFFDPARGRLTTLLGKSLPPKLRGKRRVDRSPVRLPSHGSNRKSIKEHNLLRFDARSVSIDLAGPDWSHLDLPAPFESVADKLHLTEDLERLQVALGCLTTRERFVLDCRFSEHRTTLDVIGGGLGVSRERVRQNEAMALSKLKERLL
jgi:RNA polymerase sigma factor (sigma-70 family)